MKIKQFDIWLANLKPGKGTEPGKTRPVVIVQTDFLTNTHPSTLICPLTSQVQKEARLLRIHLGKEQLDKESDVLVDQVRAIDNRRLMQHLGSLNSSQIRDLKDSLKIVLDLE